LDRQSLRLHWAKTGFKPWWERPLNAVGRRLFGGWKIGTLAVSATERLLSQSWSRSLHWSKVNPALNRGIFEWLFRVDLDLSVAPIFDNVTYLIADRTWAAINRRAAGRASKARVRPMMIDLPPSSLLFLSSPLALVPNGKTPLLVRWHDAINLLSIGWENQHDARVFSSSLQAAVDARAFFLCNSESSRRHLLAFYPQAENRSAVVYCPVRPSGSPLDPAVHQMLLSGLGLDQGNYIVTVSSTSPRKNFEGIIEIFEELIFTNPKIKLVVIGKPFRTSPGLKNSLKALRARHRLVYVQDGSRASILEIVRGAALYLSASVHEGFGKGLVEAQGLGVPVVAPRTEIFVEILGESACLYNDFDYREASSLCRRMLDDHDRREAITKVGMANAARFTPAAVLPALVRAIGAAMQ
jgi:glycosyltransferase involved in cell wall biosynthesis